MGFPPSSGGSSSPIFTNTVSGTTTATIDTGANGITGTLNLLIIHLFGRTDEAVAQSPINVVFNNDSSAIYQRVRVRGANVTASAANSVADTKVQGLLPGASATALVFGATTLTIPGYASAVGGKAGWMATDVPDATAANTLVDLWAFAYVTATAISRVAVSCATGGAHFVAGTQLLIYGS